ncbi:ATP-grasp fold amidoligase family protein [Romboutsia timonensis]|uniref:ATP-grasp fold amidoligase family protein n=1 Tax=Romboutsia timonensis TaxID=1776391 RepID=UPI0039919362
MKLLLLKISRFIPDRIYINLMFYKHFKRKVNFKNPKTLNEKVQWLKINDRKEEYTNLSDKYKVREYISNVLGEEYLIPLIGVWNSVDEIKYDDLPEQFVLKCNHDSKSVYICKDKSKFDFNDVKSKIEKKLKINAYWYGREWQYKNIKPCIIAEKYMVDESQVELKDYKIMCFNGKADSIMFCYNRHNGDTRFKFFDLDWNELPYIRDEKNPDKDYIVPKPKSLNKMIEIAEILSKGLDFVRIDLYEISGKIYFGEITLHNASGLDKDITLEADYLLGEKLKLPL